MKKRILSIILMIMMLSTTAFAEAVPRIVTSDDREVCLDVPQGKYVNGVLMVPVRRVCEMFDATCDWYGDRQEIIINSPDNITRIFLNIGQDQFRIFTFTGVLSGEAVDLPLEAPLEIVNDRTMVPFQQLCQALNGECVWSEDKSVVTVKVPETDSKKAEIRLAIDNEEVNAGEEITITIYAKNLDLINGFSFSGFSLGVVFDKAAFEHVSTNLTDNEGKLVEAMKFENAEFTEDSVKTVCLGDVPFAYGDEEVCVGKMVFRALTDEGGEIKLSNRMYTIGRDTELVYMDQAGETIVSIGSARNLKIHTQPIVLK